MRDQSPDIINLTRNLNCSEDVREKILSYDSLKYELVNTVIPVLTIILSVVGLIVNGIFIYLTIKGIREKLLPFKGYSLLLNRTFTDVLTAILTLIFVSLHKFTQITDPSIYPDEYLNQTLIDMDYLIPHGRGVFTWLLTLDFWAAAGCYAVLALLMFIAVRYPMLHYQLPDRHVVYVGAGVWLIGLVYAIVVVSVSSNNAFNVFNDNADDEGLIRWSVSTSDYILSIANLVIICVAMTIVATSYTLIVIYLRQKSRSQGDASMHFASITRIFLNVFAYFISSIVMTVFVAYPIILKSRIDKLNAEQDEDSNCQTVVDAYKTGYQMAQLTTAAMTLWQIRMILDPIVNICVDGKFKQLWKDNCCTELPQWQPTLRYSTETSSEFLRKCAERNVYPISVISGQGHYFRFRSATAITISPDEIAKQKKSNVRRFEEMIDRRVL